MHQILSPLIVLLALVGGSKGQENECDYSQQMVPGKKYYIYNNNYPQNYYPGSSCRWVLLSDRPIKMICDMINIPSSERCFRDALTLYEPGDLLGHRYCGNGNFSEITAGRSLTIILTTAPNSPGGRFLCTAQALTNNAEESNCRCGWKNPKRIVGGEETGVNEFPMMSALINIKLETIICGATIINEKQVLTAAHCVATRQAANTAVLIGDHDLTKGFELNVTELFRVEAFRVHPQYNAISSDNDIAIVAIFGIIKFSQQVGPACLPFQHSQDSFGGSFVEIIGWGSAAFADGPSNILQKAKVSVITNLKCKRSYPDISSRQLCTLTKGKDSCQFDSGGPVLWQNPTTRRIVEIGIISLGSVCGNNEPAQNTRVGAFIDWIVTNTPPGITYCSIE